MRYIKLFENFDASSIEDAKWIVIHHLGEVDSVDYTYSSNGIIKIDLSYISQDYWFSEDGVNKLEDCKNHLKEEGFFLHFSNIITGVIVVGIGESVSDYCSKWLNDNWSDLEIVESVDEPGSLLFKKEGYDDNVIYYNGNGYSPSAYIIKEIWDFFMSYIVLDSQIIRYIINNWLSEVWDLDKHIAINRNVWPHFQKLK